MNYLTDSSTRTGTLGGTFLVLILQVNLAQLINTAITAGTGAAVSFIVAISCKYIVGQFKRLTAARKSKKLRDGPFRSGKK